MVPFYKKSMSFIKRILKRPRHKEIIFSIQKKLFLKKCELIFRESIFVLKNSNLSEKSAQLTYTSILSIVPLLAILFTFIHTINGLNDFFVQTISPTIIKHFGVVAGLQISEYLHVLIKNLEVKELGVISLITFLITVILLLLRIEDTFDEIMDIKSKLSLFNRLTKCWVILTITPFILAIASIKSDQFINLIPITNFDAFNTFAIKGFRVGFGMFFQALFFIIIYYIMPTKRLNIRVVILGGIISSLLFEGLQFLNVYLARRAFSGDPIHMYGTAPLIAVLFFVWLRIIWIITLFGAALTISSQRILFYKNALSKQLFPRKSLADCLTVYKIISQQFQKSNEATTINHIVKASNLNKKEAEDWIEYLVHHKFICTSGEVSDDILYIPTYKSLMSEKDQVAFLKRLLTDDDLEKNGMISEINLLFERNQKK
ncbi:YihY/virulence factor BrkB family protein [Fluviispira multicolorata]|uniref:YihY family inner membrane protein n=1 Tax=Fluviispira multicolorata TaxID=2654512 RepID=A0A833JA86_9BACT|nr:YihY/virulence factor BrkB family protein [Fluviispira multicolorata]KAB8027714.1 YihY family inner membrane protein [Fluviispira multicolorata]